MRRRCAPAPLAAAVLCSPVLASAADLPGFYAGAAVGRAEVSENEFGFVTPLSPSGVPFGIKEHATGWRILIGLRPISLVGAELEYADLGRPSAVTPLGNVRNLGILADAHPRATSLSGLLYAPLPVPLFDLYGRFGLSRLRTDVHAGVVCTATPTNPGCPPTIPFGAFAVHGTTTKFEYGAGTQLKLSALAVRVEYERINASKADLLSVGLTWAF